jgi:hypothetical protein
MFATRGAPDPAQAFVSLLEGAQIPLRRLRPQRSQPPWTPRSKTFRKLGASIVDIAASSAPSAAFHGQWLRTRAADYSDQVRGGLLQGLAIPANAYIDSLRARGAALAEFCELVFSKVDVLHGPVLSIRTPTIADTDLGWSDHTAEVLSRITRLTSPGNYQRRLHSRWHADRHATPHPPLRRIHRPPRRSCLPTLHRLASARGFYPDVRLSNALVQGPFESSGLQLFNLG